MITEVEVLANIAVIITAIVLCTVLVRKQLFLDEQTPVFSAAISSVSTVSHGVKVGEKDIRCLVEWSLRDRTLVLALSTSCHFCTESAPFYRALEKTKPPNVQLVAILPQEPDESRNYLTKRGLHLSDIAKASLASIGVNGTPTLILVDKNGLVKQSWRENCPRPTQRRS